MMIDGVIIDMTEQFVCTKTFFTGFPFKATLSASKPCIAGMYPGSKCCLSSTTVNYLL